MDSELGERDLSISESFSTGRDGYKIAARPSFYTEQFERVCPYYMHMGVSYEQFWNGDVEIAKMARQAYELKMDEQNQFAWLQGMYVYNAVAALAPALKAFAKGKAQPYPQEPYGFAEREKVLSGQKEEKKKESAEDMRFNAFMTAWMSNVNKNFAKEGGEANGAN